MKNKNFFLPKILFALILFAVTMFVFAKSGDTAPGYSIIWIWPLTYLLSFLLLFSRLRILGIHKIAIYMLIYFRLLMRYVVYPIMVVLAGQSYTNAAVYNVTIDSDDIVTGIIIETVELLIVSLFVFFFEHFIYKKYHLKYSTGFISEKNATLSLMGPTPIYIVALVVGIVLFITVGIPNGLVGFLKINNYSEDIPKILLLIRYVIIAFLALGTIAVISFFGKIKKGLNSFCLIFSLIAGALFIGVIQSGSRASQMYVALIMISILCMTFPKNKKIIFIAIGIAFLAILLNLTFIREGTNSGWFSGDFNQLAQKLQIYFGGPSSVMTSIKAFDSLRNDGSFSILNLFYDHFDVFPFSLFLNMNSTSEMYNLFLYNGNSLSGHVIFSASYGFIFFSFFGIPFAMIVNVVVCSFFNKLFYTSKTYETKYLFGYCLFRCTSGLLVNLPSIISGVLQYLFLFGIIILFVKMFFAKRSLVLNG